MPKPKVNKPEKYTRVKYWEEWKAAEEGKATLEGTAIGMLLNNRLWCAFMAGYAAAEKEATNARK